jgi:hypothetical protein
MVADVDSSCFTTNRNQSLFMYYLSLLLSLRVISGCGRFRLPKSMCAFDGVSSWATHARAYLEGIFFEYGHPNNIHMFVYHVPIFVFSSMPRICDFESSGNSNMGLFSTRLDYCGVLMVVTMLESSRLCLPVLITWKIIVDSISPAFV